MSVIFSILNNKMLKKDGFNQKKKKGFIYTNVTAFLVHKYFS